MKKVIFFNLFAIICLSANSFAQKGFQLGVKGGISLNQIITNGGSLSNTISQNYDNKTGFVGGVWGRFGNKVYLQPEVLVAQKGGTIDIQNIGKVKFSYSNLDVPVLVGIKVFNIVNIHGGPVASFKLTEDQKLKDALGSIVSSDEAIKNASFGYHLGAGIKLMGLNLDVRKVGSLSEISQNLTSNSFKDSGWQVSLSFKII